MANPLTHVQKAKIHEDQASVFDALARAKRLEANAEKQLLTPASTETQRRAVIALYDQALRYCQLSESHTAQQADEAGQVDPP